MTASHVVTADAATSDAVTSDAMTADTLTADDVVAILGLHPHPEGGHYVETFRDTATDETGRAHSTAIYFLLRAGECSRWHRVDAIETWHFYAGAALALDISDDHAGHSIRLGNNLASGERPQAIVPTQAWQRARSLGAWTLVGCTVAPGFVFSGFELAADDFSPNMNEMTPERTPR